MSVPYYLPEPIILKLVIEANRELILICDKVLYENPGNKCLVLECSQYDIVIKLCVLLNPEGYYLENWNADMDSISSIETIEKEYNLIKSYCQKKPEYFINVYETIPLQSTKIYTNKFKGNNCFVTGYTMEKMKQDLKELYTLKKKSKTHFQKEELFCIWIKLLEILSYMQTEGLCHRDIKLQNIFIDKKEQIKIGDFGTSRELELKNFKLNESIKEFNNQDKLLTVLGTQIYMAPEIWDQYSKNNDKLHYNPFKSDLFSLGVTILNLLTLNLNMLHDNYKDIKDYQKQLVSLTQNCSNNIKNALFRMLEFEEHKRPEIHEFYKYDFLLIFKEEIEKKD